MVGLFLTTYNQLTDTQKTLESLEKNTNYPFELVISDNASTDGTIGFLKAKGYPIIENEHPVDLAAALNQGMRYLLDKTNIHYIGWIHNDMTFYPNWLSRLVDQIHRRKDIGKLAPDSLNRYGPDDPDFAEKFMAEHSDNCRPGNACPWLIRRAVIEKVGWFDERFVKCGGYEDWDYNNRILEAGYQVMITKGSVVWHPTMGTRQNHDETEPGRMNAELYSQKWGGSNPKV